jgi:hypothetical protein
MELEEMPSLGKEHVQENEVGSTERLGSNSVGRSNDDEDDGGLDMHAIFES